MKMLSRSKKYLILAGGNIKMSKKNYMSLLKEAISEFDTSDNLEVKGPMLDPILAWDGDGEIPVYKDAASILERYYFNEDKDEGVNTLDEAELDKDKQNDKGSASGPSMKHTDGAGTEQGGTSDSPTVLGSKEEKAKDIKKEQAGEDDDDDDDMEEVEEKEYSDKDTPKKKKYTEESEDLDMENAIIEKLIAEMEDDDDEDDDDKDDEEEVEESEVMTQKGAGVKNPAPKEKKSTDPEQDTKGAGTEQAGTGTDAGQVPDRKDHADKMTKPKNYNESDENAMIEAALAELESEIAEQDDAEDDDKPEEKDLDVDKEMASEQSASAVPGGPSPKKTGEDWEDDEAAYSEAFQLFKEAIKDDDDEDDDMEDDKED
jgi:hypothetical protein